ncbi:hypothetical protein TNCV_3539311 [Trichonephila clavipes]|nr:hypothetical protein TNCV_3539311 [Trichonephila clavipes]
MYYCIELFSYAPDFARSFCFSIILARARSFDRKYFHRLYVNFSNCSTICGGLFWPRIKLFWIPLFGFNHFESPKTQQLVSEVGLNANNKSDGGPVPDSSRKIDRQHECQYGRNEIGVDRHECQYGRNEIGLD